MDKEKTLALTILSDPDAAALPQPAESGRLPALVSGLSAVHRAHLAAALRSKYQRPAVILCPDDAAASALAGDFTALTGEDCEILPGRDYVLYSADAVSRSGEQRRLTALDALSVLTAEMLSRSVEILCEEDSLAIYLNEPLPSGFCANTIRLRESGSLCSLLSRIPGAFAFTSPLPDSSLKEYRLVQKKYAAPKMTDAVIFPEDARLTRTESAFLDAVRQTAAGLQVF